MNVALHKIVPVADQGAFHEPTPEMIEECRTQLAQLSPKQLDFIFNPATEPELLRIHEMSRHSPLQIVYFGIPILIVLAVIFSGGQFSFKVIGTGIEAKINSLGDGIKSLKKALASGRNVEVGYVVKGTKVKLSKEEYRELLKQSPDSKDKGGFQRFLVGLQGRVNKQTLELELSSNDLERIHRWKSNSSKGGWQSRFKKIFGRLFTDGGVS